MNRTTGITLEISGFVNANNMKILITENQNYVLRRYQQFIEIVEGRIKEYERQGASDWWCSAVHSPDRLVTVLTDWSIEEFVSHNWDFFEDDYEKVESGMNLIDLDAIFEKNYGNYVRDLWVRKCGSKN